jgi:hypothetical protein
MFNQDLQALGDNMRMLLSCVVDVKDAARITSTKDTIITIIKAILEAAQFIDDHLSKNRVGE